MLKLVSVLYKKKTYQAYNLLSYIQNRDKGRKVGQQDKSNDMLATLQFELALIWKDGLKHRLISLLKFKTTFVHTNDYDDDSTLTPTILHTNRQYNTTQTIDNIGKNLIN